MLAADDRRRKTSRSYRRGWNSIPETPKAKPAETPPQPPASSGGGIVLLLIGSGVLGFLISRRKKGKPAPAQPTRNPPAPASTLTRAVPAAASPTVRVSVSSHSVGPADVWRESEAAWRSAGQRVEVQGTDITRGMIYVGAQLRANNGYGSPDNCLINLSLDARPVGQGNPDAGLTYWPSYSRLPPGTRHAYLEWLAGERSNPATNIGYVFLYFYGLERRLMLDEAPGDAAMVLAEVERLREVYGTNASFRGYSNRLIAAARARLGLESSIAPVFERIGSDLPLGLRMTLGRFASAREPVPADWMLSWAINHPELYPRASVGRDPETFRGLFARRWASSRPQGTVFTDAQLASFPRLQCAYRAASNSFEVSVPTGEGLTDVAGARELVEQAHKVALGCGDELDAYNRLIGRRPEAKASILAGSLLPIDVDANQRAREAVAQRITGSGSQTVAELISWVEASPPLENAGAGHLRKVAVALRALGFGVTPDPDLTMMRITPALPAGLYSLPPGSDDVPEAMSAAALVLQIGALVATADGEVSEEERMELLQAAVSAKLDPRQVARLKAQAEWLLAHPARPSDLKQRLAKASSETRAWVVDVALEMARRDGRIVAAEVRQLEQIFGWLGLPNAKLYSVLHGGEPVEVAAAEAVPPGQGIPPRTPQGRRLDPERIAQITRDSARSASLLNAVFAEDEEEQPLPSANPTVSGGQGAFAGLSDSLAALAREVGARDNWPRDKLERLAHAQGVMLEGAMESLNDWALDRFDDLLIEDGDPVRINRHLLTQRVER